MAFSIQTNVNSLIAQENLRVNSNFQSQTIQRLTSGYRINSSGDDAAGLAIANKFRNDTAELTQGVRNANDGISQLQIMDGGMNNIGKMLDRLKTLATQSASSTFTGNRQVLNSEYQTLVGEIDRQAQSIGLSTGGRFAQSMGVYVGGGTTAAGAADTANGTINLDLANSVVDTKALGLMASEYTAESKVGSDIGSGSATSVAAIGTNGANGSSATFNFTGPAFKNVAVTVTLSGASDARSLVNELNAAIATAGNAGTSDANALRDANIQASIVTDANGAQRLQFSSANSAFQVDAGSKAANALMGNFKASTTTTPEGADVAATVTGAGQLASGVVAGATTADLHFVKTDGTEVTFAGIDVSGDQAARLAAVQGALAGSGISATLSNNKLVFTSAAGTSFQAMVSGDTTNSLGLGTWQGGFGTTSFANGSATATVGGSNTSTYQFSINGGQAITLTVDSTTVGSAAAALNLAFGQNATLKAAGLHADGTANGSTAIALTTNPATNIRLNLVSGNDLQLAGAAGPTGGGGLALGTNYGMSANNVTTEAMSTSATGLGTANDVFSFSGMRNTSDSQQISISTVDAQGNAQATSITLTGAAGTSNAGNIDVAISNINARLQGSGNASLMKIAAVKELNAAGTAEGIRFISSDTSFSVKIGTAMNNSVANPVGLYDGTAGAASTQNITVNSTVAGTMDISTAAGALQAVVALGNAVQQLGVAQAAIGKGQNQLNYAISLANSQISNFSAAQSQIRDADVASEAANLSKAQVLQQASIAAMAQANSAPQAVLSLLKG